MVSALIIPGRIKPIATQEYLHKYTLGEISNGMFEPSHLKCKLNTVENLIPRADYELFSNYHDLANNIL